MLSFQHYWHLLSQYLLPHWRRLIGLSAPLLGGIALQLLSPQFIRWFLDTATNDGSLRTLVMLAILFCVVGFAGEACAVGTSYLGAQLGWLATNELRAK